MGDRELRGGGECTSCKASVLIFLSILEVIACKILKIVLIMKMFTFVLTQEKKLKLRPTNVKKGRGRALLISTLYLYSWYLA